MSLNLSKILQTKIICTHANCADGITSALILHSILPNAEIKFLLHSTKEYLELKAESNMLFCDLCPPEDRIMEFVNVGSIVLDHHKGVENLIKLFGNNGVFADEKLNPGVSGAVLAYKKIFVPLTTHNYNSKQFVKKLSKLIGIRDTWQRNAKSWQKASEISEAISFWPTEKLLSTPFSDIESWNHCLTVGPVLYQKHLLAAQDALNKSFNIEYNGNKIKIISSTRLTSNAIDLCDPKPNLLIGFSHICDNNQPKLLLSFRSNGSINCFELAKKYNGGGHTNAAGCLIELNDNSFQPYELIKNICNQYFKDF